MSVSNPKKVKRTDTFRTWLAGLKDDETRAAVDGRVQRMAFGLYGSDVKPLGEGVTELKVDYGPGYRVYFTETTSNVIVLLLMGGDKGTQDANIKAAKKMLREMKDAAAKAKKKREAEEKAEAKKAEKAKSKDKSKRK
ncbi:MAG: type II toxin-antitoxin system RelE/ParE family toxin [Pseudomonadota bacterium]